MADVVAIMAGSRTSPFSGLRIAPPMREVGAMARFSLRLPDAAVKTAGTAIGLDLTTGLNRAVEHAGRVALRLGPEEWLILAPEDDADAVTTALDRAMPDGMFSLVDIGQRQTGIVVEGVQAATILNAGCPLDLDIATFPVGMATRTVFAKAEIVLWRRSKTQFHVEVWRSFVPYLSALLTEIGREYPEPQ